MRLKTAGEIFKKSGFKKASPEEKIAAVFTQLQSTHDAIFIFEKDKLLGTVNLYHSFINKRISPNEKARNCLYHPPILAKNTSLREVARLMVESRVYQLPLVDRGRFLGVVFAEEVLKRARKWDLFKMSIGKGLKLRKLILTDLNTSVSQALHLMVKGNINRLLVIDKNGSLLGILTLFDLRQVLTTPKERISFLMRMPIRKELASQPIKKFYQRSIVSVDDQDSLKKAVALMLNNNVGSLVVFSKSGGDKPVGLITFRDLMKFIAEFGQKKNDISLLRQFNKESLKSARENALKKLNWLLRNNSLLANRVKSISLDLREIAKGRPQVRLPLMEATALVRFSRGNKTIRAKARGRKIIFMVDEIISHVKSLVRKQRERMIK